MAECVPRFEVPQQWGKGINMIALILAAGYATRLYPLTENFPKPLLPVGGKPILDWLIEDLSPVTDAFIVVIVFQFVPAAHTEKDMSCITPMSIPVLEMGLAIVI